MSKRTFRVSPYLAVAMSLAGAGCGLPPQGSPGGASNTTEQSALVGGTVDSTQYRKRCTDPTLQDGRVRAA